MRQVAVMQAPNKTLDRSNRSRQMSDLLARLAMGPDRSVFAEIYGYFAPRVKSYMMSRNVSESQAEDLTQEALLTVWRKAHLFDQKKAAASTWIFTIARNLHIDAVRKEKRPEPDPNDPFWVGEEPEQPDAELSRSEDANRVWTALSRLPEEQQEVVRLSYLEEQTHGEIADQLGLPLGTVKSRIRLGFNRLREHLGDDL